MKTLLKQLIKEELNLVLINLNEGRFEDVALGFPEFKDTILWFKENNLNSKYIKWLAKQFTVNGFSEQEIDKEDLLELLNNFDNLSEKKQILNKDINSYKSLYDLTNLVEFELENLKSKELNKSKEKDYETIYSDGDWLVTQPNSMEASCKLGLNTKWCVSATKGDNAFGNYIRQGIKILFIQDRKTSKKYAITYNKHKGQILMFDEQDNQIDSSIIGSLLPENVIKLLNSNLKTNALSKGYKLKDDNGTFLYISETSQSIKETLEEAVKNGINLYNINLEGANLEGANLQGANLVYASLYEVNLQGANLQGANLKEASFQGANLQGANLQETYLKDAYLQEANLEGVNFTGAILRGTYVSKNQIKNLEPFMDSVIDYNLINWVK